MFNDIKSGNQVYRNQNNIKSELHAGHCAGTGLTPALVLCGATSIQGNQKTDIFKCILSLIGENKSFPCLSEPDLTPTS